MRSVFAKMAAPSVQQQSQRIADTTAKQAAQQASSVPSQQAAVQIQPPPAPVLPSPEQAASAPALQPSAPTQAQVSPTQAPPPISASVPQIMQQAEYEVPGGTPSSTILPIPIGGGSAPVMGGGGTRMLPIGVSKQALLNSYYQAQLIGFLYKQG
jgi:type II secretory pathway pseudopilin PulG